MDRRNFLQTTGLTTVAALVGRNALAATEKTAKTPSESAPVNKLPSRSEVNVSDTWDLSSLYPNDDAWQEAFAAWKKQFDGYKPFQGRLSDSAETLAKCLTFDLDISRTAERLGNYAFLKCSEDQGNDTYQRMKGQFEKSAAEVGQISSFIRPEILAMPSAKMNEYMKSEALAPYKLMLERVVRFKPHTLSDKEERLLAMQAEMAGSPVQIFNQLADVDLVFPSVKDDQGNMVQLSHGNFTKFLDSPNRDVRAAAFHAYFSQYDAHAHTFAASLNAAVQGDIYYAKVRNFPSAIEASLFPDNVPVAVYDSLIEAMHRRLPALHHYYEVRKRKMGLKDIHHYDTYVPILSAQRSRHSWEDAVKTIVTALQPLGSDYCGTIEKGLTTDRWCDRYENRGKKSGAFSSGGYDGKPYILMNFQPEVLDSVFTLAHEGGHSMHSHLSSTTQPYAYAQYSLMVAEVASTFNETLLSRYLLNQAKDNQERAFLLNREIDAIKQTIFRQTMFAEFEKLAHASVEAGEPLTLEQLKKLYHGVLRTYFGPDFTLDPQLDLECLRIPHFYRNFYVYKYATGLSAAIALADRVQKGGPQELNDYLGFLKGGCSKDPLDLLRSAGVDMEKPEPVEAALAHFDAMVKELDTLI